MRKILVGLFFCLFLAIFIYIFYPNKVENEKRALATVSAMAEGKIPAPAERPLDKSIKPLPSKRMPKKLVKQVRAAIESNSVCELIAIPVHDYDFCFSTLDPWMGDVKGDAELEEIFAKNGPLFSSLPAERKSVAARFFEALRLAQLFDICGASGYAKPNFREAEKILRDLEQEDSQNAVYPFFRLALLKMRKANKDEIISALDAMTRGTFFDSHLSKMTNFIYEVSLHNETFWFHGMSVTSRYPIPSYFGSVRALKELASEPLESEKVSRVAELMMHEAVNSRKPYWEMSYIPMEFALGRSLAIAADPRVKENIIKYEKLFEAGQSFGPDMIPIASATDCNQNAIRDFYENIRRINSVILE